VRDGNHLLFSLTTSSSLFNNETKLHKEVILSNENERELTDEELEQVLGGGDVNVAKLTNSPITAQALNGNTVNAIPQVPISVVNTSV
jgi:hypothetical protein